MTTCDIAELAAELRNVGTVLGSAGSDDDFAAGLWAGIRIAMNLAADHIDQRIGDAADMEEAS